MDSKNVLTDTAAVRRIDRAASARAPRPRALALRAGHTFLISVGAFAETCQCAVR